MSSYYYLLSSLSGLSFDSCPVTWESFLKCCLGNVSEKEYSILENLTPDTAKGSPFLEKWGCFYGNLKKELTIRRSKKAGINIKNEVSVSSDIIQNVTHAMETENPLEAEMGLLKFCFNFLDMETSLSMFNQDALMGYALKLKLLERKSVFNEMDGQKEFRRLFSNLQSVIKSV